MPCPLGCVTKLGIGTWSLSIDNKKNGREVHISVIQLVKRAFETKCKFIFKSVLLILSILGSTLPYLTTG